MTGCISLGKQLLDQALSATNSDLPASNHSQPYCDSPPISTMVTILMVIP
jgi:hypothetical protein